MNAGVIVAGGRSTRFGETDKAVANLAGTPMIRRVAERIQPSIDVLVINCRREQASAIDEAMATYAPAVSYAFDEKPDRGPLAGIATGLSAATDATYAFVVACDMPFVEASVVAFLFEIASGSDGAVPRIEDGWFQPTHAVYRVEAMHRACREALSHGDDRIVHAIERLDCRIVGADRIREHGSLTTFENVNTKAELLDAERRLTGDASSG